MEEKKTPENKVDINAIRAEATKTEQARVRDILNYGSKFGLMDDAQDFIGRNKSVEDFKSFALETLEKRQNERKVEDTVPSIQSKTNAASIGMSEKEKNEYSFVRAIRAHAFPNERKFREEASFEMEVSEAAASKQPTAQRGTFVVPHDMLIHQYQPKKRDLIVGNDATASPTLDQFGFYTVPTFTLSMIEILRNRMYTQAAGATILTGLSGDISFPRHDTAAIGYWVDENGAVTESTQVIGQVPLTPKTVGALTEYSRKLLIQSSIDVESFVRNDQAAVLARAIDNKALAGDGTGNTPTGVINTSGVGTSTIGSGSPLTVWSDVVNLWTDVATANADMGALGYISAINVCAYLRTAKKDAGSGRFVEENGQIDGYPVYATNQMTSSKTVFGNWNELVIGFFGGLDILVDPYSNSNTGAVRIVTFQSADIAVRHAGSFSVGTLA